MANYLTYNILLESSQKPISGWDDKFSSGGTQHSRKLHSKQNYDFDIIHHLTLAQWNTLFADYTAAPRDVRTLTYFAESPAVTYSVLFTGAPTIIKNYGNDKLRVRSPLRGFKD